MAAEENQWWVVCQCAWKGVPECSVGVSVQLLTGRQGNAGATEVWLWLPPFLLLLSPNLPISASPAFFLVSLSHIFILLFSSWSQGPVPAFPVLVLFYFILFILAQQATSYDCAVFMCHREKFSNDYTKPFLFTISPKDWFFRYVGRHWGLSDSVVKRNPFLTQEFDISCSRNTRPKTKFFASVDNLWAPL